MKYKKYSISILLTWELANIGNKNLSSYIHLDKEKLFFENIKRKNKYIKYQCKLRSIILVHTANYFITSIVQIDRDN